MSPRARSTSFERVTTETRIKGRVTIDGTGHLWIVDRGRILEYEPPFANGQAATAVLGQHDFTSVAAPNPPTADSVSFPGGPVAFTTQGLVGCGHRQQSCAGVCASDAGTGSRRHDQPA